MCVCAFIYVMETCLFCTYINDKTCQLELNSSFTAFVKVKFRKVTMDIYKGIQIFQIQTLKILNDE